MEQFYRPVITIFLITSFLWSSSRISVSLAGENLIGTITSHKTPKEQYQLAIEFEKGKNAPPDARMAVYWLFRSARSGYAPAEAELGFLLDKGEGVKKDSLQSAHWYFLAAQQGNPRAQTNLAWDYEHGEGVSRNLEKAVYWYQKAARSGYPRAENNLGTLYTKGLGVSRDNLKAIFWYKKAARQNYAISQTNLGIIYSNGQGVPKNPEKARTWFKMAAQRGNAQAQEFLGEVTAPESFTVHPVSVHKESGTRLHNSKAELIASPDSHPPDVDHPPFFNRERPDDFALVVGVENYPDGLPSAKFALNDAQSVFRIMLSMGIPSNHIRRLSEGTATLSRIKSALFWINRNAQPDATVWIYYSGHGTRDEKGIPYIVPYDADPSDLDNTAFPLPGLFQSLLQIKVHRTIIALDSCFSGAGERSIMPEGVRPLIVTRESDLFESPDGSNHLIFFSAAGPGQEAGVFREARHGLFTYFLLRGLEGAAALNGHITVSGLNRYLKRNVPQMAGLQNRDQTPELSPPPLGKEADVTLR